MTEKTRGAKKRKHRKIIDWKWLVPLLIGVLGFFIQVALAPIIGIREAENSMAEKLWMSGEDIPPLNLIYSVTDAGELHNEYNPTLSYTLYIEQRLVFLNPVVWAPSRTYYAPYEGCELVRVTRSEHIAYEEVNDTAVTLSSTTRYFDKERSSIELTWQLSDCSAERVRLQSQRSENGLRVQVSNDYDYPVQYLGMVKLPPLRNNTLYLIEDSPPTLLASESLEIRTESSARRQFEVDFPFIIELPEHMLITFDVQILEPLPKISLVLQAATLPPPPPAFMPMVVSGWLIGVIVVAVVILGTIFVLTRMRRRP